jgi:predicted dehydrogenase
VYDFGKGPAVSSTGGFIPAQSFPFDARAFFNLEKAAITMGEEIKVFPKGEEPYNLEIAPEDGYYWELRDFVTCVKEGRPSLVVSPKEAIESIELCRAEMQSVLEKREIVF